MAAHILLKELNDATRRWHADVDEPWLELTRPAVSKRDYVAQLVRMYGFEAPLEGACAYTPQLARTIELRQLTRAGLIAQDLISLDLSPADVAALPQCFSITMFKDVPEALGWLYVVERSTLHHDQVRRHLTNRLSDSGIERACAYLGMYERGMDHWHRFGRTLHLVASQSSTFKQVIDAAHAGFDCMRRWFRKSHSSLRITG